MLNRVNSSSPEPRDDVFCLGLNKESDPPTLHCCCFQVTFREFGASTSINRHVSPQAAQSRKVNNYKDFYGNLDNELKKIFTRKSSQ